MNPAAAIGWLADATNWAGPNGIPVRLGEHVVLSAVALIVAILIALPAGLYVGHTGRGSGIAVGVANVGRAVPSLALIGLVLPITQAIDPANGFFVYPTLLAMIVLAIPPVLVNAFAGIRAVDAEVVGAARGMGLTERQVLLRVEVPLALPVVLGGVRSAAVQVIATLTLGSYFGMGGLGRFIFDGNAQNDDGMLFGGVVLVALLALTAEGLMAALQRLATSTSTGTRRAGRARSQVARPA